MEVMPRRPTSPAKSTSPAWDVSEPRTSLPVALGREVDDVARADQRLVVGPQVHLAEAGVPGLGRLDVLLIHGGIGAAELESDALPMTPAVSTVLTRASTSASRRLPLFFVIIVVAYLAPSLESFRACRALADAASITQRPCRTSRSTLSAEEATSRFAARARRSAPS